MAKKATRSEQHLTKDDLSAEVINMLDRKVKLYAVGNSDRTLRNVAVDLIHASGQRWSQLAESCFLAPATIKNLATEKTQRPQADTLERIYRHFGYQMRLNRVSIHPSHGNAPKPGTKAG